MAISAAVVLSGCGASDALVITGISAKGAVVPGTVSATCASGTGTATVQSNGSYRVEVVNHESIHAHDAYALIERQR
jgi:hypothetical protein